MKKYFCLICLFSLTLFRSFTQDYDRNLLHLNWLITDPVHLIADTNGAYLLWNAGILGAGYAASIPHDYALDYIQENWNSDNWMTYYSLADNFGEGLPWIVSAGLYSVGTVYGNTKLQDAAFTSIQCGIYVEQLTSAYKQIWGRTRPCDTEDNLDFSFISGEDSFPSGHTSAAFALMSPWFFYYPSWYTALLFVAPISTGLARIGQDKHWTSDVLAGAALGICTGYYLTMIHQRQDSNLVVLPVMGSETLGISLSMNY